jgi:hypothetical protein
VANSVGLSTLNLSRIAGLVGAAGVILVGKMLAARHQARELQA